QAARLRPDPGVRAVHRPAARTYRYERSGGAQERQESAGGQDADDARRPRARSGRDAGIHEGAGRRRLEGTARRFTTGTERRRDRAFAARRDVREETVHHDSARRAHSSDGYGVDSDAAGELEAAVALLAGRRSDIASAQRSG